MIISGGIGLPFERRRADVQRVQDQSIQIQRVSGRILVNGAGESIVDVTFPVTFTELPAFSFGGEMAANQALEATNLPTISAVVLHWNVIEKMSKEYYYIGASLAVVSTGVSTHQIYCHWHMEGKAFRNPLANASNTDVAI